MKMFLYILLLFLLVGCTNPFSTRDPDKPVVSSTVQLSNNLQTDPDSLLSKLRIAFEFKNSNYYQEVLADSTQVGKEFVFVPEKDESFRLVNWTRQDEMNYFNHLINNKDIKSIRVSFFEIQPWRSFTLSTDTLQTQLTYKIQLQFRTKNENYQGRTIFKILRSNLSLWYIYYWEDLRLNEEETDSTWSTLKANFRFN